MKHLFHVFALGGLLLMPLMGYGQGFSPEAATKRMKLPPGFSVRAVATEPMVRQPLSMSFDERGRLWVLQYLQYPNPAGLKPVKQDQYLRTIWDKFPEPPPRGPKGADRITICFDPDENGVFQKSKDFISGLNLASGFCIGHGGVFVVQSPYLLFYADKNQDDVPDGDPEVLLTGFGMDDTHSVANSLQWGPDGWLYGAAGSTSTCRIQTPNSLSKGKPEVVEFQQGIWRYHPKTKQFELFSEGGGNTFGLDFNKNGECIAGTNSTGFAMLHQMQGAYYIKGFSKHGPLHNPYSYGYFEHVPYKGFKGGHVTCGGVLYEADVYPKEYRGQYIAGNLLSNAVYRNTMTPKGASFTAEPGGDLLQANDSWFRPVDLMLGPDGCIYVADWYDKRAAHIDPIDNWDKTNGRVYRIEYQGGPKYPTFDLRFKSSGELVELLNNANVWWRREARRLLVERNDETVLNTLKTNILERRGQLALESLWTFYQLDPALILDLAQDFLRSDNESIRAWTVRFLGDHIAYRPGPLDRRTKTALQDLASKDTSAVVLAQIACTAKRLTATDGLELVGQLLRRADTDAISALPLLVWWAIESHINADPILAANTVLATASTGPASLGLLERFMRRTLSDGRPKSFVVYQTILNAELAASGDGKRLATIVRATEMAMDSGAIVDAKILTPHFHTVRKKLPQDDTALRLLAKLGDRDAIAEVRTHVLNVALPDSQRLTWIATASRLKAGDFTTLWVEQLPLAKTDSLRSGLLDAASLGGNAKTMETIFTLYPTWSAGVKKKAIGVLVSRPTWARELFLRYAAGTFPKSDLTLDHAKIAVTLNDPELTSQVEKHFGKFGPATAGEKQARITALNLLLSREGAGDVSNGKVIFTKQCGVCHQLHAEGGKVGPDLTTADRKNRNYMLSQIVDPSSYIRPEFIAYKIDTTDGRTLTGLVSESNGQSVTLSNVVNDLAQKTVLARADIDKMIPLAVSLMPEKLLDTLSDAEVRDLFAYITSDAPKPAAKKLKVALISGSLEYESDASFALLQKHLEANHAVECVCMFRKTDTDIAGLDQLATCDVAIFFTRRLKPEPAQLDLIKKYVESGKPVIGIRTASHGLQNWLEMDKHVFGGNYQMHHKAGPKCDVKVVEMNAKHPLLEGVKPFTTVGSLYKNPELTNDVTVLLTGSIPNITEPVAWVRDHKVSVGKTQRVFYTSLGHQADFADANFLRLVSNAVLWTTNSK